MAYKSGFFNSINGDRKYNAEDMAHFYGQLISNGVLSKAESSLQVSAGTGLTVNISKGWAWINTHWFYNDSTITLEIPTTDTNSRKDSVILRLNNEQQVDGRSITPMILTGDSLNYPEPVRTDLIYDLVLAHIDVPNNATSIGNQYITDTRANTNLCGWVTGLIEQVDTTTLFTQFQTAYSNLYQDWSKKFDDLLSAKKLDFEKWFTALETSLNIHLELKTYQNVVQTETETEELNLGIAEYEAGNLVLVNSNGLALIENLDYTINGEGANAKVKLIKHLEADNIITFTLIKGYSVENNNTIVTENQVTALANDSNVDIYIGEYTKEEE